MNVNAAILAVLLYYCGPFLLALLVLPWVVNVFNGFGYWHNAMTMLAGATGLTRRLERRRQAKHQRQRAAWEEKHYWAEVNSLPPK